MSEGWCYTVVFLTKGGWPETEMIYVDGDKTGDQLDKASQIFADRYPTRPIVSVEENAGVS